MDEAITQDLNFDLDDDILPCVSFSEGLKQHDKVAKHHICHLHQKDLPRHLVILANHQGLSHQACKELLEQEIKIHVKMAIFIRGLGNKQVQQFVDLMGCAETSIVDRRKTTSSTFSRTNIPTSMKDMWRLFTRCKSSMLRNMPQPSVRDLGDTASVSLVGAAEILLMMGIDFFYFTPNTVVVFLFTQSKNSVH